jgi:hypothetical protein
VCHRIVQNDMVRAVGFGLATSGIRTSIKEAEELLPGSIQVMSAN